MARKDHQELRKIKAGLKSLVHDFRTAQTDLKKLREIGAKESDILGVMRLMGFGAVTPEEFLTAQTAEEIGTVVMKVRQEQLSHSTQS